MDSPDAVPDHTDLIEFLDASPSPWHAVESTIDRLDGFMRLDESEAWTDLPEAGYVVRSGAIIAWRLPTGRRSSHTPFRMVGADTDSPCLRVKPRPDTGGHGWKQLAVEVYGGILNNTLARPRPGHRRSCRRRRWCGLAAQRGRTGGPCAAAGGASRSRREQRWAHARHPTAPHAGVGGRGVDPGEFASWVRGAAEMSSDPAWWELCLYDVQGAAVIGADHSLLASGRLDNQLSCWAAATALAAAEPVDHIAVAVLNDHEEVGSSSNTGAAGPFLEAVLSRIVAARGAASRSWRGRSPVRRACRPTTPMRCTRTTRSVTSRAIAPSSTLDPRSRSTRTSATPPPATPLRCSSVHARPPACRGRCSCHGTTCPAVRRSGRSRPLALASPRLTSACPSCRCIPPESSAAIDDPGHLADALGAFLTE